MEESLWTKIKRVRWKDIVHIFFFVCAYPIAIIYRLFRKHMWLLCEYGPEARDNAYYLFMFLRKNHPEIDAVYAIDPSGTDYKKVKEIGPTVKFASFKHWIYYIAAQVNISSQKGGKPNAAVCYALEVSGVWKNCRVFLQHGITKDDLPFLYYKNTKIRLFACGALPEYEYIKKHFGYPESYVKYLGFCRFDALHTAIVDKDLILIIPTWRNYLFHNLQNEEEFCETAYYKKWAELIYDPELIQLLKKYNKRAIFCMHRNMQTYSQCFKPTDSCLEILAWEKVDISKLIHSGALLITDFSSIYMDFAYMKRPVLYYQFDYQDYRNGHLSKGYFDYERDGFGPVCHTAQEILYELENTLSNSGAMELKYLERQRQFFKLYDNKNCERTYQAIKEVCNDQKN